MLSAGLEFKHLSTDAMDMPQRELQPDLSMFLASSVHDMKNSVSILIGGLERVLTQASPELFPAYQDVAHMLHETKRINSNLIQLLTTYKIGQDIYPFDPLPQSISEFALTILAQQELLLRFHGITLELDCDESLYWQFDEDLVGGVICHALNNAIRYTKDKVRLVIRETGDLLELRVEDNGSGFPAHMTQGNPEAMRATDFQGGNTGLGLYFSAMVAKLHQRRNRSGGIRLENGGTYNGGCFVLHLP